MVVVDARAPQRLIGVDVADAADEPLVEQRTLDAGAALREPAQESSLVEARVERVAGDVRNGTGHGLTVIGRHKFVDRHRPEDALVDEVEPAGSERRVLKLDADSRAQVFNAGITQQHLAAHAKVHHERVGRAKCRRCAR